VHCEYQTLGGGALCRSTDKIDSVLVEKSGLQDESDNVFSVVILSERPADSTKASMSLDQRTPSCAGALTPHDITLGTGGGSPNTTLHISHVGCKR
jgi:hypothetical protein